MIDSQNADPSPSLEEQVRAVLNSEIRPMLQSDGGDIELVAVEDNTARVRLQGACSGCPHARATLKNYVERFLREKVPAVKEVVSVD